MNTLIVNKMPSLHPRMPQAVRLWGFFALPLAEGKRRKCPNKLRHFINTFSHDSKLSALRFFNDLKTKFANERLQSRIAVYHLLENHLRRVFHQEEVGYVQTLASLLIRCHCL